MLGNQTDTGLCPDAAASVDRVIDAPGDATADAAIDADHEAFVRSLCQTLAGTTGTASRLNLISLLTAGLMSWEREIGYDEAKAQAATLVLTGVTSVMVKITELTLNDNSHTDQDAPN